MPETIYLVGQNKDFEQWEVQGVFSCLDRAIEACYSDNYFIMECILDKELPRETSNILRQMYPTISREWI